MLSFRTIIDIEPSKCKISHTSPICMIGSCFASNIGAKLQQFKFNILLNPFGILFNPLSIANALKRIDENKIFTESELVEHNNLWHSFSHHGSFSREDKNDCLVNINTELNIAHEKLKKAEFLIITFGTAWVYFYKKDNEAVANCHQLPSSEFERRLVTSEEVVEQMSNVLHLIKNANPNLQIIFTLSPVRHLADGAHTNQVSKAILLLAIEELKRSFNAIYFPAYEIVLDELRDYRFYADDMAHPSTLAIDYVFNRFSEAFFDKRTDALNVKIEEIIKAYNHKPINSSSISHIKFKESMINKILELEKQNPQLDFSKEKMHFE